jgi:hypothetical protein
MFLAVAALAGLAACGHEPKVYATVLLRVDAPKGRNESFLYTGCANQKLSPDAAVRVVYRNRQGKTVFEETLRCDIARQKYKPKDTP